MNPLLAPPPLPEGFTVKKNTFATDAYGDPCIRFHIMRRIGQQRYGAAFEVPFYKKVGYRRVGLFRHEAIEVTDHERIDAEIKKRAEWAMRDLLDIDPAAE